MVSIPYGPIDPSRPVHHNKIRRERISVDHQEPIGYINGEPLFFS